MTVTGKDILRHRNAWIVVQVETYKKPCWLYILVDMADVWYNGYHGYSFINFVLMSPWFG